MRLDSSQELKASNLHAQLNRTDIKTLAEYGIEVCQDCRGTGLIYTRHDDNDFSWDCQSYCNYCKGVGFIGLSKTESIDGVHYICGSCNGVGCSECRHIGFTDFIAHAMGR